jgi:hypothetical protein
MKKRKVRIVTGLMLGSLILMNHSSYAGLGDKFNQYIGGEFTNLNGFYIILAVISIGVIGKLYQHFFVEEEKPTSKVKINHHSHLRHHRPRPMIKKTS